MVKINNSKGDGVIDLRGSKRDEVDEIIADEPEFEITSMEEEEGMEMHHLKASPIKEADIADMRTAENVRVKFDKFASLVAAHANPELIEHCRDEDVIVSTNLLTDLANSGKSDDSKKIPMIFLIGIVLGIGLTWLLLKS